MRYPVIPIKEFARLQSGYAFKSHDWSKTGIPVVRIKNIKDGQLDLSDCAYVSEAVASAADRYKIACGDILFSMTGYIGERAWVGASEWIMLNQRVGRFIFDQKHSPEINRKYFFYVLGYIPVLQALQNRAHGAAQPNISPSAVGEVSIPLPPLDSQEKIAAILSTYDDLIENNTRRIEILEEMARRLYEEWFIQFRFPGHEGVEFTDSSLGLIPVGWTVGCLQDVITLQRGFDLPVQHRLAGSVPIISATGIGGSHVEAKVKGPGVVTGRSGSIGKVMYVHDDHWPLNTTLWGANYPLGSTLFAYYVLSSIDLKGFNVGAAVPTLNRNDIHGLPVNIPPKEIVQSFEKVAEPLHNLTEKLRRKNANLRAQRDLLLPKLISGEIDVSDIPMPT